MDCAFVEQCETRDPPMVSKLLVEHASVCVITKYLLSG